VSRIILATVFCTLSACALPLQTTYYMPSAEFGKIEQYSCAGAPPYRVVAESVGLWTSAFFDGERIEVAFYPSSPAEKIEVNSGLFTIDGDGQMIAMSNVRYHGAHSEESKAPSEEGVVVVAASVLYISARSSILNPEKMVLHIPSILIDGRSTSVQTITFQRERKLHWRFLVLNC
jgi:hypothetical protein